MAKIIIALGGMDKARIIQELQFKGLRSSGAGGQHVNKVATKVELIFDLFNSLGLTPNQKQRVGSKLAGRLNKEGLLILQCGETRSQFQNKKLVIERFFSLLEAALHVPKNRKASRPTKASIEKRLQSKKIAGQKKANRKKPDLD